MTIQELQARCFDNAKKLGWDDKPVPIPEMIALIHSEASEALEAYRNGEPLSWTEEGSGKPQGLASEFADILIRVGHYAEKLGIDLTAEVDRKLTYNLTRGYRHGGKLA
jgi:NTP pyrophosphatase (non-canonical NTP hydrolase)